MLALATERRHYGAVALTLAIAREQQGLADVFAQLRLIPRPIAVKDPFVDLNLARHDTLTPRDPLPFSLRRDRHRPGRPRRELEARTGRELMTTTGGLGDAIADRVLGRESAHGLDQRPFARERLATSQHL